MSHAEWVRRDGTKIPVKKMTDAHLVNAFRMLTRSPDDPRLPMLRDELLLRLAEQTLPCPTLDISDDCVIGGCDNYGSLGGHD